MTYEMNTSMQRERLGKAADVEDGRSSDDSADSDGQDFDDDVEGGNRHSNGYGLARAGSRGTRPGGKPGRPKAHPHPFPRFGYG